jgi:hypothetical protein
LSIIKRFVLNHTVFIRLLRSGSLIFLIFVATYCKKDPSFDIPATPYAETESIIRSKYDSYAVFGWDQYTALLDKLSQDKFIVLPINEMRNMFSDSKVVVGLRHDVDFNPFKALEMAKIEGSYGIRSTYFFLATAEYYGHFVKSSIVRSFGIEHLYKEIHNIGAEIGIHNDLLSVMIFHDIDPLIFNREEIDFYKSLDIPVYGTAAHGSILAQITVPNYQIFSDFARSDSVEYLGNKYPLGKHSLNDYGYKYEAYHINYGIYYSDSGGRWNDSEGFSGILKKLESSKPGDRIQILVHPDWWGR